MRSSRDLGSKRASDCSYNQLQPTCTGILHKMCQTTRHTGLSLAGIEQMGYSQHVRQSYSFKANACSHVSGIHDSLQSVADGDKRVPIAMNL